MDSLLHRMRQTHSNHAAGFCRAFLGLLFLMTGTMKLVVPRLRNAFSIQLTDAEIPFHAVNMWLVPLVEVVIGGMLVVGLLGRIAAFVAVVLMLVATYVHLAIQNPAAFPLQPETPIIPLVTILLCLYVLRTGSGSWSVDLQRQQSEAT